MCRKCRVRESTGILIELCDPCFDAWEAEHKAKIAASPTGRRELSDEEFEYLADRPGVDRSKN
jgi:hypothetical protein